MSWTAKFSQLIPFTMMIPDILTPCNSFRLYVGPLIPTTLVQEELGEEFE